jgi:hypothetical protein
MAGTDDTPRTTDDGLSRSRHDQRLTEDQAEHRRDRESVRSRERERQSASERDRQAFRARDRERRRAAGGSYRASLENVARNVDRLGYALARAAARAYVGTASAVGGLLFSLADTYYSRPYPYLRDYDTAPGEHDEEPLERRSRSSLSDPRRSGYYADYYDDLSMAIADAADALSQSAEEFVRAQKEFREQDMDEEEGRGEEGRTRGKRPASSDRVPKEPV